MRIAIVGAGISGMVAAYHLNKQHEITLFEANDYIGGHTNTVDVNAHAESLAIDTGFIVFNDWTYPNFIALLDELGVESQPTDMSFAVKCEKTGLEYNGGSLNQMFVQRSNLLKPRFYKMILDILRFNKEAPKLLETTDEETETVAQYVKSNGYGNEFVNNYLLPMGAAIWSCPVETFGQFPIRFIAEFYHNHGLLNIRNRPTWRVIKGGSARYVEKLTASYKDKIRLNSPVQSVTRHESCVMINSGSMTEDFDEVVFACHSDQALKMLQDSSAVETEVLSEFPYNKNVAVLHTDISLLPKRKKAWAAWNYTLRPDHTQQATVTYNMNILQSLNTEDVYCVTLNEEDRIDESKVLRKFNYAHPVYTTRRAAAQKRQHELIRSNRTSFCGAYWGNGFHEDGVNSALAVCQQFEKEAAVVSGSAANL